MVRPVGSSGRGGGFTTTGTPYRGWRSGSGSGLQGSPGVGTPASGSQVTRVSSSGSFLDEERLVWEETLGKKKTKWLRETLKDLLKAGIPKDEVRAIKMLDRLGMLLVASIGDSEHSTFEEAS